MFSLVIFLTCLFVALAAGAMAAWSDFKGLTILNWHSVAVLGSFIAAYSMMYALGHGHVFASLVSHLAAGLVMFVITAILFALKTMGAADSKLSTAYAFWAGIAGLPAFLFYMTLAGGIIGIAALVMKKRKPFKNPPPGSWVARLQEGENKVPYGIAIFCGALACFVKLGYFNQVIMSF
jgi:Flp pilus assembly protein protease CpaA